MKKKILISVIIPYYKKRNYILNTLKSLINQSFKNFEIIIIYDDSNLEDFKYLKKYSSKIKKIKIFKNKKNLGAGASRNVGIKFAKGKYIAFIDSDDYWHKDKLKIQFNYMIDKNLKISHTHYYIVNEKNKIIGKRISKKINFQMLLRSCDIGLSTVMMHRNLLIKTKFPNIKTKEDYVLWLKIIKKNQYIHSINKFLTYWRVTDESLSSNKIQKISDGYKVYRKYLKFNPMKSFFYLILLSINFLIKKIND